MLSIYPSQLPLQPSKRVVNPVISNLPNRSNQSGGPNTPATNAPTSQTSASQAVGTKRLHKPLPALPVKEQDNVYSNLDALDNCDIQSQQERRQQMQQPKHDPHSLIDVRQRLEEVGVTSTDVLLFRYTVSNRNMACVYVKLN